jgi:hypothetical protein
MKTRILITCLACSLLLNLIAIPWLGWKWVEYSMMYRRNVDYVAEFAYAVGYHRALGHNLGAELESYPTRLQVAKVENNLVEAVIWPAKNQSLVLEFADPKICYASIAELGGSANRSQPVNTQTNREPAAAGSGR